MVGMYRAYQNGASKARLSRRGIAVSAEHLSSKIEYDLIIGMSPALHRSRLRFDCSPASFDVGTIVYAFHKFDEGNDDRR